MYLSEGVLPLPPRRRRALLFLVLGEVTPSWSSFTRNCFLSRSINFLPEEEEEEGADIAPAVEGSLSPRDVAVVTGRLPKVA